MRKALSSVIYPPSGSLGAARIRAGCGSRASSRSRSNSAEMVAVGITGATMKSTQRKRPSRLDLGKLIKALFSDGKWHSLETIVTTTGAPVKSVWSTLDRMSRWGTYKTKCERKKVGMEYHFRLSPADKQISVHELIEKLTPILKELEVQGRANAATMSPPTVRIMTAKIQKLLEEWADDRPAGKGTRRTRSSSARPL
jgi:hypothetical protein